MESSGGRALPAGSRRILGGWQLTGISVVTSGVPIDLTYTASTNQVVSTTSSVYALRPNLTGSPANVYGKTLTKTNSSLNGFFNPGGVSAPTGTQLFGNSGRNNLRGPSFGQFDLAAHKRFDLRERYSLEFRLEAFNVLNATNYISPTANIGTVNSNTGVFTPNASFGQFSGATSVYPSRQVQVALRFAF